MLLALQVRWPRIATLNLLFYFEMTLMQTLTIGASWLLNRKAATPVSSGTHTHTFDSRKTEVSHPEGPTVPSSEVSCHQTEHAEILATPHLF